VDCGPPRSRRPWSDAILGALAGRDATVLAQRSPMLLLRLSGVLLLRFEESRFDALLEAPVPRVHRG